MGKVIIGIHGLANKPEESILYDWWNTSIKEGLANIGSNENFEFKMVYWANRLYRHPKHTNKDFSFDHLFNNEPYIKAKEGVLQEYKESRWDRIKAKGLDIIGDSLDSLRENSGFDALGRIVTKKLLKDLYFYYDPKQKLKLDETSEAEMAAIVLKKILLKCLKDHQNDEIMLIAHSMGSIIAYDLLRDLGRKDDNSIQIHTLLTIGSPLGFPYVTRQIVQKNKDRAKQDWLRTPAIVNTKWINFADKKDLVAVDNRLSDDFGSNAKGVHVVDDLILNDYAGSDGKANHHKSYGYLRAPELAKEISKFIST